MRRASAFLPLIILLLSCGGSKDVYMFTGFREPADAGLRLLYSEDGYRWTDLGRTFLKPEAGSSKIMRDPSLTQGPDGTYHLVWTTGWKGDFGFGYASSKDLINWSAQRWINVMEFEPTTVNVWAPELFYDDEEKQFMIIWASTIPLRFEKGIEDENNNHRMYYTTTKNFKTFTKAELFLDPGFSVIDAVIVRRERKNYVLVLKDNTRPNRNLKVSFSDAALGPYKNVSAPFTGNFTEGPAVVKVKDRWLIYYDAYQSKSYGAMATRDFKTFTDVTNVIDVPKGHKHGTIFKVKKKTLNKLKREGSNEN
jgi:hypothetical protein